MITTRKMKITKTTKKKYLIFAPSIIFLILIIFFFTHQFFQLKSIEKNKKNQGPSTAEINERFNDLPEGSTTSMAVNTTLYETAIELVKSAELILEGKILSSKTEEINIAAKGYDDYIMPYIIYKVQVEKILKGKKLDKIVYLRMLNVEQAPIPKFGETYIMPAHEYSKTKYKEKLSPSLYPSAYGFFKPNGGAIKTQNGEKTNISAKEIKDAVNNKEAYNE